MYKFFGFICLILLFACDKEKEIRTSSLQPPLVTGYIFKNIFGSPTDIAGIPNTKTGIEEGSYGYTLSVYPNPVESQVAVRLHTFKPNPKISIWIVAAKQDRSLNSFNFIQAQTAVAGGQPLIKIESTDMHNDFKLDLRDLPAGAYRVYAQIDDVLLWDNILKIN